MQPRPQFTGNRIRTPQGQPVRQSGFATTRVTRRQNKNKTPGRPSTCEIYSVMGDQTRTCAKRSSQLNRRRPEDHDVSTEDNIRVITVWSYNLSKVAIRPSTVLQPSPDCLRKDSDESLLSEPENSKVSNPVFAQISDFLFVPFSFFFY